jgi:hypothetical protein
MEPAATIIEKLGGYRAVSAALGVAYTAPYRWTYPRERGGTDGRVPAKYHRVLLDLAAESGVELSAADLVCPSSSTPSVPERRASQPNTGHPRGSEGPCPEAGSPVSGPFVSQAVP